MIQQARLFNGNLAWDNNHLEVAPEVVTKGLTWHDKNPEVIAHDEVTVKRYVGQLVLTGQGYGS